MNYVELLSAAAPETIVVLAAFAVLAVDLFAMRDVEPAIRRLIEVMIGCVGCTAAIGWMVALPQHTDLLGGIFVVDSVIQVVKIALLTLTILALLISQDSDFTKHVGEYFALILMAAAGMMFLVSSEDILFIFVSLELTSLCLYVLAAFNKGQEQSAEAAIKYFLFGGMSAAFTLFGLSLLYGLAHSTNLAEIAVAVRSAGLDPLVVLGIVMTLVGFGFKVAAAPFHLWAPDVYQGAPLPSAAFIASGSKVAGFFITARVVSTGFAGQLPNQALPAGWPVWASLLAILAAVSMVLGNFAAIVQTRVRRLLAYSAIAHAGYMLLGVIAQGTPATASLVYYVITYALTTLGAFGVVAIVQQQTGDDRLTDFAGLARRSPGLAVCMMVFILSLAGIPPLAGFFGKFYIFSAVLQGSAPGMKALWLVAMAVALSAVSLYYYLQVLKQIFVVPASAEKEIHFRTPLLQQVVLAVVALTVIVLGCAPEWLIHRLTGVTAVAGL